MENEIIVAILSGLSIRLTLSLVKQRWASTYHHTLSYILLPLITLTITHVISGNIALSLGMIGALSIVRFRNPVKNPLELVIFFALITIGISAAVEIMASIYLAILINIIIASSYYIEKIAVKYGINVYSLSFDEGNPQNTLEITSNSDIDYISNSKYLVHHIYDKTSGSRHYRLSSMHKKDLDKIRETVENEHHVQEIEIRYS